MFTKFKRKILLILFLLLTIFTFSNNKLELKKEYIYAYDIVDEILKYKAYDKKEKNEELSIKVFNNLIKQIDPAKMYISQEDLKIFDNVSKNYLNLSEEDTLKLGYTLFEIYIDRLITLHDFLIEKLKKSDFDIYTNEEFILNREKEEYPKDSEEIYKLWNKKLVNDYIRLKINNEKDDKIKEILINRYENVKKNAVKYTSEEVAQLIINSYTTTIDPHNNWYGEDEAKDFKISNSLSLVGIGVSLQQRGEENVVREIIKGGPADKSGQFVIGDRIVAVGQGEDGPLEDTSTYRLKDLVKIVRGNLGTTVRIGLKSSEDGPVRIVTLVRENIKQEDQEVSYKIVDVKRNNENHKVGYILIPGFYSPAFSDDETIGKSVSEDVKKILLDFNKKNVESVVVDLRNNGGGSLQEVLKLSGLFIGKNQPVVQVRNSQGTVEVLKSLESRIWDKPLVVMINRYSASASEIFAGVIKDYNRGILVGQTTWGKGSVQTVIDLQDLIKDDYYKEKLGLFKYTIQMFFRPNGESTQIKGVTPHIEFPSNHISDDSGEFKYENALKYREVDSAKYKTFNYLNNLNEVIKKHNDRISKSESWKFLVEQKDFESKYLNNDKVSLNYNTRVKDLEFKTETQIKFKEKSEKLGLPTAKIFEVDNGLSYNEEDLKKQIEKEKELKNIIDTETYEAFEISLDLKK